MGCPANLSIGEVVELYRKVFFLKKRRKLVMFVRLIVQNLLPQSNENCLETNSSILHSNTSDL